MERRHAFEDRRKPLITQREFERRQGLPPGFVSLAENGKILLAEAQWDRMEAALDKIAAERKEAREEVTA